MWSLFSTQSDQAGFRLQYLEIFNWGTFHNEVYRIAPEGNNSLLTGANGSGKTTLVDALLTLIMAEKRKRFYNQSSGSEKRGDRNEDTYVMGHYGDIHESGTLSSRVQALRPNKDKTYSILLACFTNENQQVLTLFQARWFVGGNMRRSYGIAHQKLEIERDFWPFDAKGEWKKRLKKEYGQDSGRGIEWFDGPSKYAERLIQLFGMRSQKALSLFNQTVGIKVLGNLNEFIRTHMLEERDAEGEFRRLKDNFDTLVDARRNIDKATEQLDRLRPIDQQAQEKIEVEAQIETNKHLRESSVVWFAQRGVALGEAEEKKLADAMQQAQGKADGLMEQQEQLREEESRIRADIERDDTSRRISELKREIRSLEKQRDQRKRKLDSYNRLAERLGFPLNPDESLFLQSREQAQTEAQLSQIRLDEWQQELYRLDREQASLQTELAEVEAEYESLKQRQNNLPAEAVQMRQQLARELGIRPEEMPFVGELIQVREEAQAWLPAIESLLRETALHLLVPDEYHRAAVAIADRTNLKQRLAFFRHRPQSTLHQMQTDEPLSLLRKLAFHPKHPYSQWVESYLETHFDLLCLEETEAIVKAQTALTPRGLYKAETGSHQRDDRPTRRREDQYVLGWDNQEKRQLLRERIKALRATLGEVQRQFKTKEKQRNAESKRKDQLRDFHKDYAEISEIEWQIPARELQAKEEQKEALEAQNDQVKALQGALAQVQRQIKELENQRDSVKEHLFGLRQQRQALEPFLADHRPWSKASGGYDAPATEAALAELDLDIPRLSYANFRKEWEVVQGQINQKQEQLSQTQQKLLRSLAQQMMQFKRPEESIYQRFPDWGADTHPLSDNPEFVSDYQRLLERLEREDLPRHRRKWEDYLNESITNKIGIFKQFFDAWQQAIRSNIDSLNEALRGINFKNNPPTYLQIRMEGKNRPVAVQDFEQQLRAAMPNFAKLGEDLEQKREHFEQHIIPFIQQLSEAEDWRKTVMDVRNWASYYAQEYYRENDEPMKSYVEMGKLSGGEKAQLTYTILGSAIAYQFGLTHEGLEPKSFRFIAVDESFSNQDEEKATYLMDLCKQLNLQLLVVTPSDKIHIVEPYISFVHYVERQNNRNSILLDMPIQQFQENRQLHSALEES